MKVKQLISSVLQVYKGVLRATGETVAVKVQRPGIGDNIAIDMLLLRQLMGVIDKNQTLVSLLPKCILELQHLPSIQGIVEASNGVLAFSSVFFPKCVIAHAQWGI